MIPNKHRSNSTVQQYNSEDFRIYKKNTNQLLEIQKEMNKENNESYANKSINRSIEEKLALMQQRVQNESLNDHYLLSSIDQSQDRKGSTQMQSVSFNIQSHDPSNLFIYSQEDFQPNEFDPPKIKNKMPPIEAKRQVNSVQRKSQDSQCNYQSTNNDSNVLQILLMEIQKRFDQFEERLDLSERNYRSSNHNNVFFEQTFRQIEERIKQVYNKITNVEQRCKLLEDALVEQKNQNEKKISDYNKYIDSSLQKFIQSSLSIQQKVDKLTEDIPLDCAKKFKKQQILLDNQKLETENLKQRLDIISQNLSDTHQTLNEQINEFTQLQKGFDNISQLDIDNSLQQYHQEIQTLKQRQIETMHYLKTFHQNITNNTLELF